MAGILTSIQLYDRVSAPINRMISAMGSMCSAFDTIQSSMDSSFDTSPIEEARRAAEQAALEMVQLGNDIDQNTNHQENFNRSVRSGGSDVDALTKKIMGIAGAYLSVQTVSKAFDLSDTITQTTARLDMMNDGLQTTEQLQQMIFQSAQNSRGAYQASADAVSKMGIMAQDAFDSNAELVAFVEQLNKQFTIAGTSQEGISSAMLQLTQAMSSGVLRGEELNSVFEQAPTIIQSIADYLDVPIGSIRDMAAEGLISSEIVKNALLSSAEETNAKFEQMPMTWGQVFTSMENQALMAFQPVLMKINELANNQQFQVLAQNAVSALSTIAVYLLQIMEFAGTVASFFIDNWSVIEPIVMGIVGAIALYNAALLIGKGIAIASAAAEAIHTMATTSWSVATFAATVQQQGLNAALMACPITWIILLIIALIAIIYAVCEAIAKATGIANSGFGVICGGVMVVIGFFKNLGLVIANFAIAVWNSVLNIGKWFKNMGLSVWAVIQNIGLGIANFFLGIVESVKAIADNIGIAFNNAWIFIQITFWTLVDGLMQGFKGIADFANKTLGWLGVNIDTSGFDFAKDKINELNEQYQEFNDVGEAFNKGSHTFEYKNVGEAWEENPIDWQGDWNKGINTFDTFQDGWAEEAFASGAAWGDGVVDGMNSMLNGFGNVLDNDVSNVMGTVNSAQMTSNVADIADNTARTADALDISTEDLKYLRDIAERDTVNRFTTAEIKVEWNNTQNINSDMDLDGVVDYFATNLQEVMESTAEGVHE